MAEYNTSSLLVPRELVYEIASGAAEIIMETSNCEPVTVVSLEKSINNTDTVSQDLKKDEAINRSFIHIFDEDERREQLRLPNLSEELRTVHETKLRELQWARSTLLADERVSAFLSSRFASLWPDVESLTEVVNVVRTLKEFTDVPPDPRGAARMQEAMQIIVNEARYSGVHTLISAPVAGKLTVYESQKMKMESPHSHQRQHQLSQQKANLARDDTISIHPVQWLLQVSRNCYILPDVLRLPMTAKTHESLLKLLHENQKEELIANNVRTLINTSTRKEDSTNFNTESSSSSSERKKQLQREWLHIVTMHRESLMRNNMPLFYSVLDAVRTFQITEQYLIELMQRAAETSAKVRIRGGVYATVIHKLETYVVLDNSGTTVTKMPSEHDRERASDVTMQKNVLTNEERNAFYKVAHMEYDTAVHKGLVLHAQHDSKNDAELEQTLRENFLSPLTCPSYTLSYNENDHNNNHNGSGNNYETKEDIEHSNNKSTSTTNHFLNNVNTITKQQCQRISITSHTLSSQTVVKHVQCQFNPFIIVHGNRVENGFRGRTEVFEELKRQRDAIAEEQTERVLRGEYNELRERAHTSATERQASSTTTAELYSPYGLTGHEKSPFDEVKRLNSDVNDSQNVNTTTATMTKKSVSASSSSSSSSLEYYSSSITSDDDALKELSWVIISVLSEGPATRAELTRRPRLARWVHHVRFDALLKNVLKMHAEYRSRKYHLRE